LASCYFKPATGKKVAAPTEASNFRPIRERPHDLSQKKGRSHQGCAFETIVPRILDLY
jgi:hypothetical protein